MSPVGAKLTTMNPIETFTDVDTPEQGIIVEARSDRDEVRFLSFESNGSTGLSDISLSANDVVALRAQLDGWLAARLVTGHH